MRRIQLATYDPEAIRSRPTAPKESPVDALLDGEDKTNSNIFDTSEELSKDIDKNLDPLEEQEKKSSKGSENFRPFEVPPVESIDESADRANRVGALIATVVLFCLAVFWKKHKRSGS